MFCPAARHCWVSSCRKCKRKETPSGVSFFMVRAIRKPGSVVDDHLSGTHVAARLKPSVGATGSVIAPVDVAADRVYRPPMLPWGVVSSYLAFPPLPEHKLWRYISVALFLKLPSADVICYPYPMQPGLSSYRSSRYATVRITRDFYYTLKAPGSSIIKLKFQSKT